MKKGSDYLVLKYVYRRVDGVYYRNHSVRWIDSLSCDFPSIDKVASVYPNFKLIMNKADREITAWTDKHHNVVVRIIDKSIVQSKINF